MPFDAIPQRAVYCKERGSCDVPFLLRDASDAPIVRAGITDWDFRVYDESNQSPEIPIFSLLAQSNAATNADTTAIISAAVIVDGKALIPAGCSFCQQLDPVALFSALGDKTYTLEYTFRLTSSAGTIVHRVPLVIESTYG